MSTIPRRASAQPDYYTTQTQRLEEPQRRHHHFFRWFMVGVIIVFVAMFLINWIVLPWVAGVEDQWQAGGGRITRFEADVGHCGVSTFICFVEDMQVIVIEVPGGDMARAKYYITGELTGTTGNPIVSVSLADVNNDGRPDLIVHVEGITSAIVLYNTGTGFSPNK